MRLEEFSEAEFQKALQRIIRALTRGKTIPDQPKAILLGGQSGAGKTTIHRIKQKEFQGNIIIIDGDSYRSQHPNYLALQDKYGKDSVDYTKGFAGKMVEHLVDELSTQGYHLLIEGTLRTTQVPRQTAQLLSSKGYQVSLAVIGTKPELSYLSTLIRYEEKVRNSLIRFKFIREIGLVFMILKLIKILQQKCYKSVSLGNGAR